MDGDPSRELEIRAFGVEFSHHGLALLKQFAHSRIAA